MLNPQRSAAARSRSSPRRWWRRSAGAAAPAQCSCHAVLYDCCPDRLRGVLDAGASRLGLHATGGAPGGVAGDDRPHAAQAGRDARRRSRSCAARRPSSTSRRCASTRPGSRSAAALLRGTGVGVCSVVGFPLGATTPDVKHYETRRAIFDGATEIDMVINVGALKSGDLRTVERDIEAVVEPCRQCGVVSKVIIEAALLTDEEKITACTLAKAAGADFVKTSTGFASGRRDRGRRRADAPGRRRRHGRQGGGRRARSRRPEGDGRGRRDAASAPAPASRSSRSRRGRSRPRASRLLARGRRRARRSSAHSRRRRHRVHGRCERRERDLDAALRRSALIDAPPQLAADLPLLQRHRLDAAASAAPPTRRTRRRRGPRSARG